MEERQVTVAKITHKMPDLFMVMATRNPIEQEGTYPLPEAQMALNIGPMSNGGRGSDMVMSAPPFGIGGPAGGCPI
jgi:hypothetical protein